jgi:hypothetical protein
MGRARFDLLGKPAQLECRACHFTIEPASAQVTFFVGDRHEIRLMSLQHLGQSSQQPGANLHAGLGPQWRGLRSQSHGIIDSLVYICLSHVQAS